MILMVTYYFNHFNPSVFSKNKKQPLADGEHGCIHKIYIALYFIRESLLFKVQGGCFGCMIINIGFLSIGIQCLWSI